MPEFAEDAPKLFGPTPKRLKLETMRDTRDTLRRDLGARGWAGDELSWEVNRRMQAQFNEKVETLKEANDNCNPAKVEELVKARVQPLTGCKRGLRIFEGYAGQGSFSKGFNDLGVGRLVGFAELNPEMYAYMEALFPGAEGFKDYKSVSTDVLVRLGVDVLAADLPA